LTSKNDIELTFDEGLGLGCKSEGHINILFENVYVLPCPKTLKCDYFKTIFDDKPSGDTEIEVIKHKTTIFYKCMP